MTTTDMERDTMSEEEEETFDATESEEGKWGALRMIGLLALLAAFAGFVYLAYMQGVRNGAMGAPPVITAEKGPYKVAPAEPGGKSFANQDKLIFDRAEGTTPMAPASSAQPAAGAPAETASTDDMLGAKATPLVVAKTEEAPAAAKPAQPGDDISRAIAQADETGQGGPVSEADEIAPSESGTAEKSGITASISPTAVTGNYLIQVASYRDMDSARDAWTKLSAKQSDIVSALKPDYQTADVPGRGKYYRLRIGPFETRDAANAVCKQLKAHNQDCLVVKG